MPRSSPGLFGRVDNLNRLIRSALVIDAILATGRSWQETAREVAEQQYVARGLTPPRADVVRRYFSLELAPALDAGYRSPLAYPSALAMQFRDVRPMFIAPIMDLLFGLDLSKVDQLERSERYSAAEIRRATLQGNDDLAEFMEAMNNAMPSRRRGRPSSQPVRPLWELYQTLLNCRQNFVEILFVRDVAGFGRAVRPIEQEVAEVSGFLNLDALAILYGLVLESLELADHKRLATARQATMDWLPNLRKLPECRRVAPLIEEAVRTACLQAVPRSFCRAAAYSRVLPAFWRDPSWSFSPLEQMFRHPSTSDSLEFYKFKGLDIKRMSVLIEKHAAQRLEQGPSDKKTSSRASRGADKPALFPFRGAAAKPIKALYEAVLSSIPSLDGWKDGAFWVMQYGTRCAIASPGHDAFALVLVDFGHMRGDPVADRPILAMPWMMADWNFIPLSQSHLAIQKRSTKFLRGG